MVIKFTTILKSFSSRKFKKKKKKQFLDGTLQMLIKIEFSLNLQLPGNKTKVNDNLYRNNFKYDKQKMKKNGIYVFILCAN